MVQCVRRKMDYKNRTHIPMEYILRAGGEINGEVYITFDEETKKIEIIPISPAPSIVLEKMKSNERV